VKGVSITYGDYDVTAKDKATFTAETPAFFCNVDYLKDYSGLETSYGDPLDYVTVFLDSKTEPFPDNPLSHNIGFFSSEKVGKNGLGVKSTITVTFNSEVKSRGITMTFDTASNGLPILLRVALYQGETSVFVKTIARKNIKSNPVAFEFDESTSYDKASFIVTGWDIPLARQHIQSIDFGIGYVFTPEMLRDVKVIQEISPISAELPANAVDFKMFADGNYNFSARQPVSVHFNGELINTGLIKSFTRRSKNEWSVKTEDYISALDNGSFLGGLYSDVLASEVLTKIFTQMSIPYEITSDFAEAKISGYIPISTCREAVRQICFAIGAVASTAGESGVKIYKLPTAETTVGLDRIMTGQSVSEDDPVTQVSVSAHEYSPIEDEEKLFEGNAGENILVTFSSPMHSLTITNGTILTSGVNYAILNAENNCTLNGKKYADNVITYVKKVPDAVGENELEITNATLVNMENAESILTRVYDYAILNKKVDMRVRIGSKPVTYGNAKYGFAKYGGRIADSAVNVGDIINSDTEYQGAIKGRIISTRYNLNGGIIVKDCEVLS
jgi:hypothetical protein